MLPDWAKKAAINFLLKTMVKGGHRSVILAINDDVQMSEKEAETVDEKDTSKFTTVFYEKNILGDINEMRKHYEDMKIAYQELKSRNGFLEPYYEKHMEKRREQLKIGQLPKEQREDAQKELDKKFD